MYAHDTQKKKKQEVKIKTEFLNPKVISTIKQKANFKGKEPFIEADLCNGFSEEHEVNAKEFPGLINDLKNFFGDNFRVIVYPNKFNQDYVNKWKEENAKLITELEGKNQFYYDEHYAKLETTKEIGEKWEALWKIDKEHEGVKAYLVKNAVDSFLARGKNKEIFDTKQSEAAVIAETINVVAAVPKKDSSDERLHIILSGEKLFDIMTESLKDDNLRKLGLKEDGIEKEPVKIKKKNTQKQCKRDNNLKGDFENGSGGSSDSSEETLVGDQSMPVKVQHKRNSISPTKSRTNESTVTYLYKEMKPLKPVRTEALELIIEKFKDDPKMLAQFIMGLEDEQNSVRPQTTTGPQIHAMGRTASFDALPKISDFPFALNNEKKPVQTGQPTDQKEYKSEIKSP